MDETCYKDDFRHGITMLREAISQCKAQGNEISLISGGGTGGGISQNCANANVYQFSTGFSFDFGPPPILKPSEENTTDENIGGNTANVRLQISCSYAYSSQICVNAGYTRDYQSLWELCECPVQQLYAPPVYAFNCSTSATTTADDDPAAASVISSQRIQENCEQWCPDPGTVTLYDGQECPVMLPSCQCKSA
jgi:hypothetical protein